MTPRRPHPIVWSAALLATLGLLLLTYLVFIRSESGQVLDDGFMVAANEVLGTEIARNGALAFLGYLPAISAGIAVLALVVALAVRRSLTAPIVAIIMALGAASTTQILKAALSRPNHGVSEATMNSFPSGHTTVAAAAMFAAVLVTSPRWRPVVATLGGLFASLAAASTYVLGWHRPADVIGAVLVAAAWTLIGGWLVLGRESGWNGWRRGERDAPSGVWLGLPWIPAVVGLATAAVLWALLLRDPARTPDQLSAWYVVAGLGLVLGSTMAIFGAIGAFLSNQTRLAD
ncbi:MAG: phosphatase PAP2 family protein [bacterium]|nr:phosphatase PAP2 family protein [bacterium]